MRSAVLAGLLTLVAAEGLRADGFRMKDGRYADGSVTVLALSPAQVVTVKTKRVLVLTEKQKMILQREGGVAPTVLQVYSLKTAGKDCTCFDFNIAIWFEATKIEVPHRFLLSDADAERRRDDIDSID